MKYFLKPLGYCLTTAVMTSAMLRLYALPTVEAATLDSDHQPLSTTALDQALESADHSLSTSVHIQVISPPETLPAESSASLSRSAPTPTEPEIKLDSQPVSRDKSATHDLVSDHWASPDAKADVESSSPSGLNLGSSPDPVFNPATDPKQPAANQVPQKAEAAPVRTIAGMRQVVEKRLAVIVEQNKITREAKLRQMLIYTVMQYAWTGRFDEARQVAQHPTFSSDLQTELLAKITMIQSERQPTQLAEQSAPNQPTHSPNNLGAELGGRHIPSSYVAGLAGGASYTAISLGQQCPIPGETVPAQKSITSGQPDQTVKQRVTPGIPAFVPALSQNLAARMVQHSQFPPTAVQPASLPTAHSLVQKSSIQASEQFVGVASRLQPADSAVALAALNVQQTGAGSELQASSQVQPLELTQQPQVLQAKQSQVKSFASSKQFAPNSQFSTMMPVLWNLDQVLGIALDQSFGQLSLSLPDWISVPLTSNWSFWTASGLNQASLTQSSPNQSSSPVARSESSLLALESLEPIEQSLTAPQFGRDMRKLPSLSLAISPAKSASQAKAEALAKTPTASKPVLYDAAALLAMNCSQASLTHYSGDQVMDPANSKRMGWVNLMFPLPIAAVLTSTFGWRVHPISGSLSFHTGLDLGAPMGTPVLAATAGRVVVADQMGGYGLAGVVEDGNQRNLYGHLAGIAVQPGTQVAQGTILGWVGSTGNSTGPHLHFESQVATNSGWTAVDPIASATLATVSP